MGHKGSSLSSADFPPQPPPPAVPERQPRLGKPARNVFSPAALGSALGLLHTGYAQCTSPRVSPGCTLVNCQLNLNWLLLMRSSNTGAPHPLSLREGEEPPEEESSFPATSFFQSLPRTCWGVWRNVDSSVNQYSALALPQQTSTAPLSPRSWTGLWDTWTPPWPEMGISLISSWKPRLQTMRC